jgi:small-conductance mechanosensitive channel
MSALALKKDGAIDTERMKDLIKLFRPDRQGHLTLLDFVKSCDTVYKEMRLLRASIANSGQIDRAFEIMLNVVFYVILAIIVLAVLGLDPLALFISISGIVLAFAFMIGSASSKYFEVSGVLM